MFDKIFAPKVQIEFTIELRNRLSALQNENEGENGDQRNVEETWGNIAKLYEETAESVIGFKKGDKEWITLQTWTRIDVRRKAKDRQGRSPRLIEHAKRQYKVIDLEECPKL